MQVAILDDWFHTLRTRRASRSWPAGSSGRFRRPCSSARPRCAPGARLAIGEVREQRVANRLYLIGRDDRESAVSNGDGPLLHGQAVVYEGVWIA